MIGETILHYKILEKLGEGGMGEVYKAQDTKLDRFVALKFLPSQLTATEDEKTRFIQEAKAASAMNHPNVCTIYDIQDKDGQLFIVMEFVDGKTLKDKKDSLSEKQILEIGIQVAEGLAAAHEKGIVHRDIKPDNIMIRKDGIAQIMDFGLAKLYKESNVSRLTKAGTTVGTIGYMSPEQVQGLDVDHRTDIFSLGVVLYELLSGEPPFKGVHETAVMYEIVNVEAPPIATVKPNIDPNLDGLILECLEKEKDERCQSTKELAKNLRKIKRVSTGSRTSRMYNVNSAAYKARTGGTQISSKSSGSIAIEIFDKRFDLGKLFRSGIISWGLSFILFLLVLYFAILQKPEIEKRITTVSSILPPGNVDISQNWPSNSKISHNGKLVAFMGIDTSDGNKSKLWIRPFNSNSARSIEGCNGAGVIFWSPDDKYIAFFNNGGLYKVNINSGLPVKICEAPQGRGGTWNKEGKIVFAPDYIGGLFMVSDNGGTPVEILKSDSANKEQSLRYPFFLPDGNHFIYTVESKFSGASSADEIKVGSIDGSTNKTIFRESSNAQYANGYIFFVRQSDLMCQKFDPDNFELSGDPQMLANSVKYNSGLICGAFSVSTAGNLFIQNNNIASYRLELFNIKTKKIELLLERKYPIMDATFSPGYKKCAFTSRDLYGGNTIIYTYDFERENITRVTFGGNHPGYPVWSPDGNLIAFRAFYKGYYDIFMKYSDGSGTDSLLYHSDYAKIPTDWSSDGKEIMVYGNQPNLNRIEFINLAEQNKVNTFSSSEFIRFGRKFSRDKKWILYVSNESGTYQWYISPSDGSRGKVQVTSGTNTGRFVGWINNNKEFIYRNNDKLFKISTDLSTDNVKITASAFYSDLPDNFLDIFDISNDGKSLLFTSAGSESITPPFTYIQNWKGLLNEKED